jgi:AAA15 family ATPase/GTPase
MIHSLEIEGYRGFDRFSMDSLGVVNLLVGKNNSGKTSLLEALYLLSTGGDPFAFWTICGRRGERMLIEGDRGPDSETDVAHLFYGHDLQIGSKFVLSSKNQKSEKALTFAISEMSEKERETVDALETRSRLSLTIKDGRHPTRSLPITANGGVSFESVDRARRVRRLPTQEPTRSYFISADSLSADDLLRIWDKVALTPKEQLVLRALQFLDPQIEGIRAIGGSRQYGLSRRGGFIIKLENLKSPIRIGSMGDGMWRILAMAMAVSQNTDGVSLVDEIDTGLHYSVMSAMWRLISNAAREFNVEVFATTHSYDCVHSLSSICRDRNEESSEITIQRIETGQKKAISFTEAEIKVAAERHLEIR